MSYNFRAACWVGATAAAMLRRTSSGVSGCVLVVALLAIGRRPLSGPRDGAGKVPALDDHSLAKDGPEKKDGPGFAVCAVDRDLLLAVRQVC